MLYYNKILGNLRVLCKNAIEYILESKRKPYIKRLREKIDSLQCELCECEKRNANNK